jgi:hypothetical protein
MHWEILKGKEAAANETGMQWVSGLRSYVFGGDEPVQGPKVDARSNPEVLFACLEHVETSGNGAGYLLFAMSHVACCMLVGRRKRVRLGVVHAMRCIWDVPFARGDTLP